MNTERRHPSFGDAPGATLGGYRQPAHIVDLKKNAEVSKMEAANSLSQPVPFFRLHGKKGSGQTILLEQFQAESWVVPLKRLGTSVDRGFGFSS